MKVIKIVTPAKRQANCTKCEFQCKGWNEKELVRALKEHAKKAHGKTLTDNDVKNRMKWVP